MKTSFEFFPPRTEKGKQNLAQVRQELSVIQPDYFSVTFGAGGTTQDATLETILNIQKNDTIPAAPHLSCIGSEKENIIELLDQYKAAGVNRIVALRGDIPSGVRDIGDFHYANELVEFIKTHYNEQFHIEVAAYPEMHPQAKNIHADLQHFANKVKTGADSAITQYFYNADAYFRFVDDIEKLGINIPITPGIMPITNYAQLVRFSQMCGAEIPKWILERLKLYENDLDALSAFGTEVVTNLCQTLKSQGVESFHFYSMNRSQPSLDIAKTVL
ncbi:5,10-methylenetetrahydrofolate reductase [Bathymodiolus thermophilus thioautotrophic gill symbiont]|uniref:Methylenetetrahydrofolate reductase n=1 Tax=Bathymodiolus thermophilus thioautotrophic gill symbiont TaxID=2360 RepID=A0A1J5TW87_9GAMM|nr:methylenetetrahydrofolate reductase [NAD(P)H] [Bathymodiolus thermophilus thioautotrophic gill symbiont]AYQ57403.1 5,10-methylenetetrahydrofolate reductase [Bathymodiolus thermophilus thioautotrophic gill symbiont]OIR25107.1 methylenetetrahydrofolate reductase [NAD(P)H] [Bathymodiolus thermophilus thioautotrophic gill symbiont]CAB5495201.1 5,10-methylenetetrahydrofolate reductase (EC [Bathymodiolus thermophilus thioautotrophic gill symbiont]CAB5504185.1 5,10-methylenetetrahydrofolate reducta